MTNERLDEIENDPLVTSGAQRELIAALREAWRERDEANRRYVGQRMDCDSHTALAEDRATAAESELARLRPVVEALSAAARRFMDEANSARMTGAWGLVERYGDELLSALAAVAALDRAESANAQ